MDENDLAPFIGRIVLENLSLSKEVGQLRERVAELEEEHTEHERWCAGAVKPPAAWEAAS